MKRYFVLFALVVVACAMPAFGQVCPSGASWCSGLYKYDGMGNIRAIGSDTYIYDTVGRLVSGTAEKQRGGISEQDYEYDTFGNRTSASRVTGSVDCLGGCEQAPTIDPLTNHITGNSAAYDAAGNLISITNTVGTTTYASTYVYDAAGSMARATAGSDDRQFIYTADDERITTRSGQSWTWTVRGMDGKVLREFTSAEPNNSPGLPTTFRQWTKDYVWRDGQLLASVTPSGSSSATQHFHLDHLGTPRLVSNDNGVQTGIHAYYPFGAELNLTPNEQPTELMKFTGHERDLLASNPNTLDYMHARYEMGTMGRFLSVDPVLGEPTQPQSWNRYAYVSNNPISFSDATGRERGRYGPPPKISPSEHTAFHQFAGRLLDRGANVIADVLIIGELLEVGGGSGESAAFEKLEADAAEVETALTEDVVVESSTDFVATPKGDVIAVPNGANGPNAPKRGSGMSYQDGSGGKGMDSKTTGVRIMDANATQEQHVNYMNRTGQTVNPSTGKTIPNSDPAGHVPLKPFDPSTPIKKDPPTQ